MFLYLKKSRFFLFSCICFFLFSFTGDYVFANTSFKQGKYLSSSVVKNVRLGMSKSRINNLLGDPICIFTQKMDCWIYYYLNTPNDKSIKIVRQNMLLFFKNDRLIYYRLLY